MGQPALARGCLGPVQAPSVHREGVGERILAERLLSLAGPSDVVAPMGVKPAVTPGARASVWFQQGCVTRPSWYWYRQRPTPPLIGGDEPEKRPSPDPTLVDLAGLATHFQTRPGFQWISQ